MSVQAYIHNRRVPCVSHVQVASLKVEMQSLLLDPALGMPYPDTVAPGSGGYSAAVASNDQGIGLTTSVTPRVFVVLEHAGQAVATPAVALRPRSAGASEANDDEVRFEDFKVTFPVVHPGRPVKMSVYELAPHLARPRLLATGQLLTSSPR